MTRMHDCNYCTTLLQRHTFYRGRLVQFEADRVPSESTRLSENGIPTRNHDTSRSGHHDLISRQRTLRCKRFCRERLLKMQRRHGGKHSVES